MVPCVRVGLGVGLVVLVACSGEVGDGDEDAHASTGAGGGATTSSATGAGGASSTTSTSSTTAAGGASTTTSSATGGAGGATGGGTDDAEIAAAVFPQALGCTAKTTVVVTVKNTGTSTWTKAGGVALGAVDDDDPLHPGDVRVQLGDGDAVPPGASHDFAVTLAAPGAAGAYTTDWRMVRDAVGWFGGVASASVSVACESASPDDFDLASVTIVASPDVRGFAVTSAITSLAFSPGTFHVDHDKRGQWPPVVIADDGTEQEATVWVFFRIGGAWYGTGGERLRPDQTDKQLDAPSQIGPGWLYDPNRWGIMTGYVPSPGDLVGFLVAAGSTRSDDHVIAEERTGAVLVPFPEDGVATGFPPFAWQEAGP
jgi:hypothetical protein